MYETIVSVTNVRKSFNSVVAVSDVSLEIRKGEVLGILGPNGAGKTTLIRLILDIIRPDAGVVEVFGRQLREEDKDRIGYLPEERGLYLKQRTCNVLEYFGSLKGLTRSQARSNALAWLTRCEMLDVANKKIGELSKGNQQKVQLISSLIADPEIVVFDEPFSGLDPVNSRMVSALIADLATTGKTILLSSHRMDLVEALCQRVLMVNKGKRVLYGDLSDIKRQHSRKAVLVDSNADYAKCDLISDWEPRNNKASVYLRDGVRPVAFLEWLLKTGADVRSFEQFTPSLEDIFVSVIQDGKSEATASAAND